MSFNDYPRACALGFEKVSPLQGSFQSIGVNKMILWVHYRRIFLGVGVALAGLFYVFTTNQLFYCFHGLALACPQAGAYRVSYYSYLCKDLILGML